MTRWRGLAVLLLAAVTALLVVAPGLVPFDPLNQDLGALNQGPGSTHLLGTDHLGRDVFSRLVAGAGTTLAVALGGAILAMLLGAGIGILACASGPWAEAVAFSAVDTLRGLPPTLLALVALAGLGSGVAPLVAALAASFAPLFAHVARAAWRREAMADYVAAAVVSGAGPTRLLVRHIIPNLSGPLITLFAIVVPRCVVTESVLSFLGLGSAPDTPTWGRMAADASRLAETAPHALIAPIIAITLVTTTTALAGNRRRRRADPLRSAL